MLVRFADDELRRLYYDESYHPKGMDRVLVRAFRKKVDRQLPILERKRSG